MAAAGTYHTVLLRSDGRAIAVGSNAVGQCTIPALAEGKAYAQAATGSMHTVLLCSDGSAVVVGSNRYGQCDLPTLEKGAAYVQAAAGQFHTMLLRHDGQAVAFGRNTAGECDIPALPSGLTYAQLSAGGTHSVLLRSDGSAVAIGGNQYGQCDIPGLHDGEQYTQVSAGGWHTVLLRSDGRPTAVGRNSWSQCSLPIVTGARCVQVAAGGMHTLLLHSDGRARAVGVNRNGQCSVPIWEPPLTCIQVSAGLSHSIFLGSDGSAIAVGDDREGQCQLPPVADGLFYTFGPAGGDRVLQLTIAPDHGDDGDAVQLTCCSLAGVELARLRVSRLDAMVGMQERIAAAIGAIARECEMTAGQPFKAMTNVCTVGTMLEDTPMVEGCNEWFLFHGANESKCLKICKDNFNLGLAGTGATWKDGSGRGRPLYGHGIYFADRCTKADEYSDEVPFGNRFAGCHTLMVSRVIGGRTQYCDTNEINPEALQKQVIQGPFHSVFGDRVTKLKKPYREVVVYDSMQCYPEYIVYYNRLYA